MYGNVSVSISGPNTASAGNCNNNTKVADLSTNSQAGLITGVKVVWSNYIVGLDVHFGGKTGNPVVGSHNQGLWDENFNLANGDHIVELYGRKTDVITCLGFRTARGLTKVWGNPFDGEPFSLFKQGQVLRSLKLGVTNYLSYVEAHFVDELDIFAQKVEFNNGISREFGKKAQGDSFDDYEWIKGKFNYSIAEVKIWHDNKAVYGIQFFYAMDGTRKTPGNHLVFANNLITESLTLTEDDWIEKVYVRAGEWIDNITIVSKNGKKLSAGGKGGNPYVVKAAEGKNIVAFAGNLGNVLHTLEVFEADL